MLGAVGGVRSVGCGEGAKTKSQAHEKATHAALVVPLLLASQSGCGIEPRCAAAGRHAATSAASASAPMSPLSAQGSAGSTLTSTARIILPAASASARPKCQARGHWQQGLPHCQTRQAGRRGAQCHTHAEFAYPCRHAVADDAVDAERREHERDEREAAHQVRGHLLAPDLAIEDLVERCRLEHRRLRVSVPRRPADRRRAAPPVCHARAPPVSSPRDLDASPAARSAECRPRRFGAQTRSRCCASVTTPTIVRGGLASLRGAKRMRCPTAPPRGNAAARQRLVDNDHRHGVLTVGRLEGGGPPPGAVTSSRSIRCDDPVRGARLLARTRHGPSLDQIPERPEIARNRQVVDGSGRRDARQRRDVLNRRLEERLGARRRALRLPPSSATAGRLEAEIHLPSERDVRPSSPGRPAAPARGRLPPIPARSSAPSCKRPGHRTAVARGSDQRTVHLAREKQRRGETGQQRRGEREHQHGVETSTTAGGGSASGGSTCASSFRRRPRRRGDRPPFRRAERQPFREEQPD